MVQPATLQFLKQLKKNNNKAWFDEHRDKYEQAKRDFVAFVQDIIDTHARKDPSLQGIQAKNCLFRINRDIRFSKNKSPYKTNFGASINKDGRKAGSAGYYIHLEPGSIFVGGGMYQPTPEDLGKVRQEIDYCLPEFRKIVEGRRFRNTFEELDQSAEFLLSRVPRGYSPDNPAGPFLKLKSIIAFASVTDKDATSKEFRKITLHAFDTLQPLITFLNRAIS